MIPNRWRENQAFCGLTYQESAKRAGPGFGPDRVNRDSGSEIGNHGIEDKETGAGRADSVAGRRLDHAVGDQVG
jgi:hypothetical protein